MTIALFVRGMRDGMASFGSALSATVNAALLTIAYIVGVGLTSFIARLLGKRFIDTKRRKSYWRKLGLKDRPAERFYRQF